jgi:hypothetical protein
MTMKMTRTKSVNLLVLASFGGSGSVVYAMLQAGRWRVLFPMSLLHFPIYLVLPAAIWLLESTQPLTETSIRNLTEGKALPAHKADNLTAICEPIF